MNRINSGYVLLDAGGLDLSSNSAQSIAGSWTSVQACVKTNKPIVAYNMVYGEGPNGHTRSTIGIHQRSRHSRRYL